MLIVLLLMLLSGCGARETFETLGNACIGGSLPEPKQIHVELPREAAAVANSAQSAVLYLCDGYDVTVQTLSGGDLDATIRSTTGYDRTELTVIELASGKYMRYDIAWSCAGEGQEQICRATILDDGAYHYVLTCMGPQADYRTMGKAWDEILGSFDLT